MYGGGFTTVPAYLADMFGTQYVGAIHGRLLTAWSTAGIAGPVIVNYLHDTRVAEGVPRDHVYDQIFYVLACLLVAGFICNALIRPVRAKWHMEEEDGMPKSHGKPQALRSKVGGWKSACLGRLEDPRKRRENLSIAGPSGFAKAPWLWFHLRRIVGTAEAGRLGVKRCQILFACMNFPFELKQDRVAVAPGRASRCG
jgi:MFS family permease